MSCVSNVKKLEEEKEQDTFFITNMQHKKIVLKQWTLKFLKTQLLMIIPHEAFGTRDRDKKDKKEG